jgi:hypothetical protein
VLIAGALFDGKVATGVLVRVPSRAEGQQLDCRLESNFEVSLHRAVSTGRGRFAEIRIRDVGVKAAKRVPIEDIESIHAEDTLHVFGE